ncbi:recombinase family protein [Burkholderia multivorans]|uniref:recombinase family protein n=1 Tax=Burkholderia multivorans TaxID=87883 RepID=UPI0021C1F506|nr:recombinase family protein [Burkholderia multivorans]
MSRVFAYCRVSTIDQSTENQRREIEAAGFAIDSRRIVEESISGSVAASERPGFVRLLDRLEAGDVLVVTKLDRLGRNAMDVTATVDRLAELGVRVHCLQLGGMDLNSPAGRMTMGVLNHVAQFERDLLIERTQAGISRAKAAGKAFGRPSALTREQQQQAAQRIAAGDAIAAIARDMGTTRQTIMRLREKAAGQHFQTA